MSHLLDTSAFLAFFLGERGADHVKSLFEDSDNSIAISSLTMLEFWACLKSIGREAEFEREWALHLPLFEAVIGVDTRIAEQAIVLRNNTPQRLPTIDALIAATAATHNLALVHRDPHFRSIDNELLKQIDLGKTASTS